MAAQIAVHDLLRANIHTKHSDDLLIEGLIAQNQNPDCPRSENMAKVLAAWDSHPLQKRINAIMDSLRGKSTVNVPLKDDNGVTQALLIVDFSTVSTNIVTDQTNSWQIIDETRKATVCFRFEDAYIQMGNSKLLLDVIYPKIYNVDVYDDMEQIFNKLMEDMQHIVSCSAFCLEPFFPRSLMSDIFKNPSPEVIRSFQQDFQFVQNLLASMVWPMSNFSYALRNFASDVVKSFRQNYRVGHDVPQHVIDTILLISKYCSTIKHYPKKGIILTDGKKANTIAITKKEHGYVRGNLKSQVHAEHQVLKKLMN